MNIVELEQKSLPDLRDVARDLGLSGYAALKRQDLVFRLLQAETERQGFIFSAGVLEIVEDGFGFLRQERFIRQGRTLPLSSMDVYVSQTQIRRFGLRTGDMVSGQVRPPKDNEKYYGLLRVDAVNGQDPEAVKQRPLFDGLTPIFPNVMYVLETNAPSVTGRMIDLIAPIGRGQRALVVAPP
ncbi:MAG TPA: Rho termination factor N-terminal domain-containing protein, partial [Ktedonobacterales bacterium]